MHRNPDAEAVTAFRGIRAPHVTLPFAPAIWVDSNPATTKIAGMMIPMLHFVSPLTTRAYHGQALRQLEPETNRGERMPQTVGGVPPVGLSVSRPTPLPANRSANGRRGSQKSLSERGLRRGQQIHSNFINHSLSVAYNALASDALEARRLHELRHRPAQAARIPSVGHP